MSEVRIYISGPIDHHDINERKSAFSDAQLALEREGFEPVNPFNNGLPETAHWRQHMKADLQLLLTCGYIYMLRGWEQSKGAKLEFDVATSCGLTVIYEQPLFIF